MAWPVHDSMNQHLEELNENDFSRPLKVSMVRMEGPHKNPGGKHIRHVHPYWQMELVFDGNSYVEFENKTIHLEAGDILIIPPQNWHYYVFGDIGKKAWSIKFSFENIEEKMEPVIINKTEETQLLTKWLNEIIQPGECCSRNRFVLIEHLIASLLDLHYFGHDLQGTELSIIKHVRKVIEEQEGKAIQVQELANKLHFSTTYLTRIFKKQLGVPLKVFIDQQRFEIAKRLLLFSTLNISEIAEEMGFDNLFSFSRFFKRLSGESPQFYLNKNRCR